MQAFCQGVDTYETNHQHTHAFKWVELVTSRWAEGPHLHSRANYPCRCHVEPAYCVQMGICTCTVLRLKHGLHTDGWIPWRRCQGQTCLLYWLKHLSQDPQKTKNQSFLSYINWQVAAITPTVAVFAVEYSSLFHEDSRVEENLPLTTIMAP